MYGWAVMLDVRSASMATDTIVAFVWVLMRK